MKDLSKQTLKISIIILIIGLIVGFLLDISVVIGIILGTIFSYIHLWLIKSSVFKMTSEVKIPFSFTSYLLRMLVLAFPLYLGYRFEFVNILAVAVGLLNIKVSLILGTIFVEIGENNDKI